MPRKPSARARMASWRRRSCARKLTKTASTASAPTVAAASTTCDRANRISSPSSVRGMPSSAVRSSAPKSSAGISAFAPAMAAALTMPRAVSRSGITRREGAAAATRSTSCSDSVLGTTTASMRSDSDATHFRSSSIQAVRTPLTRTNCAEPDVDDDASHSPIVCRASALRRRVDAILEIEDDGVCPGRHGFGKPVGAGARHEENGSQQGRHARHCHRSWRAGLGAPRQGARARRVTIRRRPRADSNPRTCRAGCRATPRRAARRTPAGRTGSGCCCTAASARRAPAAPCGAPARHRP